jgi:hypothetical protein
MKRNAAVVLGNVGTVDDLPALEQALGDPEPLVRKHAAPALTRLRVTPGRCQRAPRALTPADGSGGARQNEQLVPA